METQRELSLVLFIAALCTTGLSVCPDGYCRHSGDCYLIVNITVSWIDARSYCAILSGVLFSPTTSTMQTAAAGALRKNAGFASPGKFWLDFTDLINPKDWKRMSDRNSLTYTNWASSASSTNATEPQNCAYMSEEDGYKWNIASCNEKMNFVCFNSG